MVTTVFSLIASVIIIYFSCEIFINGIEWVGRKFNIARNAVGTVLAAFGTALPESVVTFIAVVFGASAEQKDIGVGAALGGPLVLSTIAYAVVGWSIIIFRKKRTQGMKFDLDSDKLGRDQLWFLFIFAFKVLLGFLVFSIKPWTGLFFLAAYGFYFYKEMSAEVEIKEEIIEPLRFRPKSKEPETGWILFQTLLALSLIFVGSHIFVKNLETISLTSGVPAHIISLFLSPVATELPEILNAVIWVRQGKEILALANISGAMMIQATVPSALGIIFTPWLFDKNLALAGTITILSIIFLWLTLRSKRLSVGRLSFTALFYVVFAIGFFLLNG